VRFPLRASPADRTRVSGAPKVTCPFCQGGASTVERSRPSITKEEIRRRRQCVQCGQRFATVERIDWPAFWREHPGRPRADAPPPMTLDDLEKAVRRVWNQAISRIYSERDWHALERLVAALQWHQPGATRPRRPRAPRARPRPRRRRVNWPLLWAEHPELRVALLAALKAHQ